MRKLNIYVVDDEEITCKAIKRFLSLEEHSVRYEINPKAALINILNENPDLLITDIQMPEISGIEIVELVRKKNPEIPVILISAYFDKKIIETFGDTSRIEFLEKPFGGLDLLVCLDRVAF